MGFFFPPIPAAGFEPGFCMMCTMQNHIIQVFANSGNVIKPIGVLNELKSKYVTNCSYALTFTAMTGNDWQEALCLFLLYHFGGKFIFVSLTQYFAND